MIEPKPEVDTVYREERCVSLSQRIIVIFTLLLRPGITFELETVKCHGNQIRKWPHLKVGWEENQALLHFAVLASLMSSPMTINMKAWK